MVSSLLPSVYVSSPQEVLSLSQINYKGLPSLEAFYPLQLAFSVSILTLRIPGGTMVIDVQSSSPPINVLAGPPLLGYMFNWGLFGALVVQVYNYHISFPHDSRVSKAVVYGVFLVELVQTFIMTRDCFITYASGFGDLDALNSMNLIWLSGPMMIGVVSCTVQIYYAYRVYVLSGLKSLSLVICAIALMQGSSAIAQGVQAKEIWWISNLEANAFITCSVWLAGSAVCDFIITCSMAYFLLRRDSQVPGTHTIVVKLVRLIIETGVLTATGATIDLIVFLRFPGKPFHTALTFSLAKLYSNSLLVLFNNRSQFQRNAAGDFVLKDVISGKRRHARGSRRASIMLPGGGVHVEQTVSVQTDEITLQDTGTKSELV